MTAGHAAPPAPKPDVVFGGLRHPRFQLEHELGHGGFGVVWSAWDKEHAQRVAVKVLHRNDASALRRFKGEFRTLANVAHENLVSLYELHQDEDRWFFTMELVDGTTFYDWIVATAREAPLPGARAPSVALTRPARPGAMRAPPPAALLATTPSAGAAEAFAGTTPEPTAATPEVRSEAVHARPSHAPTPLSLPEPFHGIDVPDAATLALWDATRPRVGSARAPEVDWARLRAAFHQLAQALAWLHGSGHLHRDVKPSNILVTRGGLVKVLDFGLVTRLFATELAPPDALVGTPVYMAPELCANLSASPASDWYSLGVMLYTILTGSLPFSGETEHVLLAKQALDARPASEVVDGPLPTDLVALCGALLSRNPIERPDAARILAAFRTGEAALRPPESATFARPHALPASFVGRTAEVARLAALASRAPGVGEAIVVMVEGLSGVGKTSLVEHVLREAEARGDLVLRSRCFERGSVRFKALDGAIDDLARHLAQLSRHELEGLLPKDPHDRAALARLFPVLPRRPEATHAEHAEVDPVEVKRRAFKGLRALLAAVAERRRVLVEIDDAQWSDDDSLAPLLELMRAPSPAVLWLVAYRSDEKAQSSFLRAFAGAVDELIPAAARSVIALGPLGVEEAYRLASERLGTASDPEALARARAIAQEAGGHPLLIDELARANTVGAGGDASVSERLAALLGARIAGLTAQARTLVELVAIASEPVDVRVIRAATGADQRDLNLLILERLVRSRPGGHGETVVAWHDRVRETAIASIDAPTRVRRHRALAEAALRLGDADPSFLYVHWRGAGEAERAREQAVLAAEASERVLAFDRAGELYEAALELSGAPDPALLERLAVARKNGGRGIEAGRRYLEAATVARDEAQVRRLELAAAEQFLFAGGLAEGEAVIARVLGRIGLSMRRSIPALMGSLLWQSARLKLRGDRFAPRAEADLEPARRDVVDTLWSVTIGMSMAHPLTSTTLQKRHLRMALDLGEPLRVVRALAIELAFSGLPGGPPGSKADRASQALSVRSHEVASTIAHPYAEAFVTMSDGATHWLRGRWKEARRAVTAALDVYETACVGVTWEKDTSRFVALAALLHQGALAELASEADRALADAAQRGDRFLDTQLRCRFAPVMRLAAGRPDDVEPLVASALAGWSAGGYQVVHFYGWVARIEALLYKGDGAAARALFDAGVKPLKRSFILLGQYYRVQFHDLRGRVALAVGDTKAATHAARVLRDEGMPWASALGELIGALAARDPERLVAASAGLAAVDMQLHRLAADHARAALVGDEALARAARSQVGALGVVQVEVFFRVLLGV
ncbi:MAG: protein kinase [Deltaproteobacteria bacterium]|nr:protein kinase [Deltaproteobacteria bacterium]